MNVPVARSPQIAQTLQLIERLECISLTSSIMVEFDINGDEVSSSLSINKIKNFSVPFSHTYQYLIKVLCFFKNIFCFGKQHDSQVLSFFMQNQFKKSISCEKNFILQ
jgi:hypothetical protein